MWRARHSAQPVHRAANGALVTLVLTRTPRVSLPQTLLLQARAAVGKGPDVGGVHEHGVASLSWDPPRPGSF